MVSEHHFNNTPPLQKKPKQVSKKQGSVDLNFSIKRIINSYPISEKILIFFPIFLNWLLLTTIFREPFTFYGSFKCNNFTQCTTRQRGGSYESTTTGSRDAAISTRPHLQLWTIVQIFFHMQTIFSSFMNQLTLILIHPGNYVSSLSKFCPYHFVYFFPIPSACSGRFVPVVNDDRYKCYLYEARAMNYSSSEKECLNMGADLVEYPIDFMKIQILVRLTGLYLNSTLFILMI